jgi:processive 1,2-diacylglycerol beta-glucosyltransferase
VRKQTEKDIERDRPVLILTISNGAGHIRVAQGIAAAIDGLSTPMPVLIADVGDYMNPVARFTHVTAYLWLVKYAPAVWDRIDRYQKRQPQTSPEWYYRHGCQKLFRLANQMRPRALIATEVGCCEIASLIKRDLALDVPLVAASDAPDVERAWVQPEVDLYCFASDQNREELLRHGAPAERTRSWGAPLAVGFDFPRERAADRSAVCSWLALDPQQPLVLIAGGGEGMGRIEEVTGRLLQIRDAKLQIVVLTGRNERLRKRCARLASPADEERLRVLSWAWPENMPKLMTAADLMISKLGTMFNEAVATALPIVALEPPPGSERFQYRLLEEWKVGRAVRTVDEVCTTVTDLITHPMKLSAMREQSRARRKLDATRQIACWLRDATNYRYAGSDACRDMSTDYQTSLVQGVRC